MGLLFIGYVLCGVNGVLGVVISNLYMEVGYVFFVMLIEDIVFGVYVIELMGGGVNGVIGDYSCGVLGFWIENGVVIGLVVEFMIVGNVKDMFLVMMFVNDFEFCYGVNVLMLCVEGMMVVSG